MFAQRKMVFVLGLTFCLMLAFVMSAFSSTEIKGHWAEKQIIDWQAKNLIAGYSDGTFKPDHNMTRAEFITLVNKAFGFTKKSQVNFVDVHASDWFAEEVAKAKAVGYISGYADGTMKPNNMIERQEVAAVLCRILKLDSSKYKDTVNKFKDANTIPQWSRNKINAVVANNYMAGYPDQTYKPRKSISRGEVVAVLDRVVGVLYNTAGTYGTAESTQTIKGNATISKSDVILRNTLIGGNLYLTEGIGDGKVTLDNVTVKGTTTVSGGGANSVVIINSLLGSVVVNVPDDSKVRVVASGTTIIAKVEAQSKSKLEETNLTGAGFSEVVINIPTAAGIELKGDFGKVLLDSANTKVSIMEGVISELTLSPEAKGSNVSLAAGSTVKTLTLNGAADITGQGKIETATRLSRNHSEIKSGAFALLL